MKQMELFLNLNGVLTPRDNKTLGEIAAVMTAPEPYFVQAPFGPARLPGETLAEYINRYTAPESTGGNCTVEICPGSTRRAIFHGETEYNRVRIQFLGSTYSTGEPRIQTLNRGVVTLD